MRTAISIPDDIFVEAEQLTRRLNVSRSRLYTDALKEYLARHDGDAVTEAMNRVCDAAGEAMDPAAVAVGRRLLTRVEW
jgi:metal-responsive CopG/Arc/MetJ family transcriptional regulator